MMPVGSSGPTGKAAAPRPAMGPAPGQCAGAQHRPPARARRGRAPRGPQQRAGAGRAPPAAPAGSGHWEALPLAGVRRTSLARRAMPALRLGQRRLVCRPQLPVSPRPPGYTAPRACTAEAYYISDIAGSACHGSPIHILRWALGRKLKGRVCRIGQFVISNQNKDPHNTRW
jgi:hypothetical protein